ncbi:phage shock protein operon transcriptional activator [bacterium]|nr:phage shock protein operon transcriptional activator [bacterium]
MSHDPIEPREEPFPERFQALGQSHAYLDFQEQLRRVAPVDRPVLLVGERGTGKEMAVRRLHYLSGRWGSPFVALNCAALSPSLIESELFGHEEGAFTGARRRRVGRFESADKGTLFLDEISLIPIETQEKILRVVEYSTFERVGSSRPVQADVRIVGATNADLVHEAREGRFKRDLLDRLSFEVLFLPPLREREEDILLLAHHFASRMCHELGREELPFLSDTVQEALMAYSWPGNIRELKNVVERAVYLAEGTEIDRIEFDPFDSPYAPKDTKADVPRQDSREETRPAGSEEKEPSPTECLEKMISETVNGGEGIDLYDTLRRVELEAIRRALKAARYNQREAAGKLGLTYHQFRGLYRKHKIELEGE